MSQPPEFTDEEMRAMEAEMERITVDDVVLQTIVSLVNLAARKAGLTAPPGQAPEPDWEQVRQGIEAARALMPLVEARHADQIGPIRDGLSQLQVIYVQQSGATPIAEGAAPAPGAPPEPKRPEPPSRLWVPGQ
jgi:hypothetical protein